MLNVEPMKTMLTILGCLLIVVGVVWSSQGLSLIGGSFMTGQRAWLWIGFGVAVLGIALLFVASRRAH